MTRRKDELILPERETLAGWSWGRLPRAWRCRGSGSSGRAPPGCRVGTVRTSSFLSAAFAALLLKTNRYVYFRSSSVGVCGYVCVLVGRLRAQWVTNDMWADDNAIIRVGSIRSFQLVR